MVSSVKVRHSHTPILTSTGTVGQYNNVKLLFPFSSQKLLQLFTPPQEVTHQET